MMFYNSASPFTNENHSIAFQQQLSLAWVVHLFDVHYNVCDQQRASMDRWSVVIVLRGGYCALGHGPW